MDPSWILPFAGAKTYVSIYESLIYDSDGFVSDGAAHE